jgi:psiF repeat
MIEEDRTMKTFVSATLLSLMIGMGTAFAQAPAPAPAAPPATAAKPAKPTKAEQSAVSKECSTQADAKNLHGKERKKFRAECKRNGGKAS